MTSLVPGLGKRKLHFCQLWRDRKIILRAGTELKFENYESVQHRLGFSGIKKGAKISFHRHFKDRAIIPDALLRTLAGILSRPVLFDTFKLF